MSARIPRVSSIGCSGPDWRPEDRRVRAPGDRPVRPVDLVEVDIVGLEPPEALVHRLLDLRARQLAGRAVVPEPGHLRAADHLGGQHDPVAPAAALEPGSDDALGRPLRLRPRRDRVELRGVEEVDAPVDRVIHLRMALGLGVLLAPGHGSEADLADGEAGAAERAFAHGEWSARRQAPRSRDAGAGAGGGVSGLRQEAARRVRKVSTLGRIRSTMISTPFRVG